MMELILFIPLIWIASKFSDYVDHKIKTGNVIQVMFIGGKRGRKHLSVEVISDNGDENDS